MMEPCYTVNLYFYGSSLIQMGDVSSKTQRRLVILRERTNKDYLKYLETTRKI